MSLNCGGSLLGARYDTGLELVLLQGARYAAVISLGSNVWASSGPSLDGSIVLKYTSGTGTSHKSSMVLVLSSGYNRWTACSIICFNSKCRKIMSDIFMLNSLLTHHHQEC